MVKCAWASQSENKTANGKKGDQTGTEVKIGNYYNFGQDKLIRFRNPARGKVAAIAAKKMAQNDNIGYGQNDRTSLYNECQKINWDIKKISSIKLCNCDCSEFVACAINFAYGKPMVPSGCTTRTLEYYTVITHKNNFKLVKSFRQSITKSGDILLRAGHHTIMVISNTK